MTYSTALFVIIKTLDCLISDYLRDVWIRVTYRETNGLATLYEPLLLGDQLIGCLSGQSQEGIVCCYCTWQTDRFLYKKQCSNPASPN
jgi:hypothetical protein